MITPDRLAALIAAWTREAEVAEANQRTDEYAKMCRDTAQALREFDISAMTPDHRVERFEDLARQYCMHCGNDQPKTGIRCQCWNDE